MEERKEALHLEKKPTVMEEVKTVQLPVSHMTEVPGVHEQRIAVPEIGAVFIDSLPTGVEQEAHRLRSMALDDEAHTHASVLRNAELAKAKAALVLAEADASARESLAGLEALEKHKLASEQAHAILEAAQREKEQVLGGVHSQVERELERARQMTEEAERAAVEKAERVERHAMESLHAIGRKDSDDNMKGAKEEHLDSGARPETQRGQDREIPASSFETYVIPDSKAGAPHHEKKGLMAKIKEKLKDF